MQTNNSAYDEYIKYLENLDKELSDYLPLINIKDLFSDDFENFETKSIPDRTKPVLPEYTSGPFRLGDISKLLGKVYIRNIEPDKREIKPMENAVTVSKSESKRKKEEKIKRRLM